MEEKYSERLLAYSHYATKEDYDRVYQLVMCITPLFNEDVDGVELRKQMIDEGYLVSVEGWKILGWKGVYELLDAKILIP